MKFIVHVTGPDEIHELESEIEALKLANDINKVSHNVKWSSDDPESYPTVIALVYSSFEYAKLNQ